MLANSRYHGGLSAPWPAAPGAGTGVCEVAGQEAPCRGNNHSSSSSGADLPPAALLEQVCGRISPTPKPVLTL